MNLPSAALSEGPVARFLDRIWFRRSDDPRFRLFRSLVLTFVASVMSSLILASFVMMVMVETAATERIATLKEVRNFYSDRMGYAAKLSAGNQLWQHVPVPTTFMLEFGASLPVDRGRVSLQSPLPFETREARTPNEFAEDAWNEIALKKAPGFKKLSLSSTGTPYLVVARPDVMSSPVCVDCHNNLPESPRRDWKLGDVRGIYITETPLSSSIRLIVAGSVGVGAVNVVLLGCFLGWRRRAELMERMAHEDPLTGLSNRRFFEKTLLEHAQRQDNGEISDIALMVLDIDNFKSVNDTYGHSVGDEVICKIGQILQRGVRNEDLVARVGGEEMVVLLPATPIKDAEVVGKRLVKSIERADVLKQHNHLVTVSAGLACRHAGMDVEALFEAADKALYTSKQTGKNRLTLADGAA